MLISIGRLAFSIASCKRGFAEPMLTLYGLPSVLPSPFADTPQDFPKPSNTTKNLPRSPLSSLLESQPTKPPPAAYSRIFCTPFLKKDFEVPAIDDDKDTFDTFDFMLYVHSRECYNEIRERRRRYE